MLLGTKLLTIPTKDAPNDWQGVASAFANVHASAIVVLMDPWETSKGSIELPDEVQERLRPTSAVVIAVGVWTPDLLPGDRVLVTRRGGQWIDGLHERQVRVYGPSSPNERHYFEDDGCVFAKLENGQMKCIKDKVLLLRDPVERSDGSILLIDKAANRPVTATVVDAGPEAYLGPMDSPGARFAPKPEPPLKAGDRVIYNPLATADACGSDASMFGLDGCPEDYAFIRARDISAVLA